MTCQLSSSNNGRIFRPGKDDCHDVNYTVPKVLVFVGLKMLRGCNMENLLVVQSNFVNFNF